MANDLSNVYVLHNAQSASLSRQLEVAQQAIRRVFSMSYAGAQPLAEIVDNCWTLPEVAEYIGGAEGIALRASKYQISRAISAAFTAYVDSKLGV